MGMVGITLLVSDELYCMASAACKTLSREANFDGKFIPLTFNCLELMSQFFAAFSHVQIDNDGITFFSN